MDIQKWITAIDQITAAFDDQFRQLSTEQLNWKPAAQSWSVAQHIDHLIAINDSYHTVVKEVRSRRFSVPLMGRWPFFTRMMGNMILKSVEPSNQRKMTTFPLWEPAAQSDIPSTILEDYTKSQAALKALIAATTDLLSDKQIIYSPANKKVLYALETAYDIIVAHAWRHLAQAKALWAVQQKNALH
jgi:hypothetical protein